MPGSEELVGLRKKIRQVVLPPIDEGLQILPVAHDKFQARWNLSMGSLQKGLETASGQKDDTHLVLRAFSLPAEAGAKDISKKWHDFGIEGTHNSAYFCLPAGAPKISVALGLINKSGQFMPLARTESISMPYEPVRVSPRAVEESAGEDGQPAKRPAATEALKEFQISERLDRLNGLPESFKKSTMPLSATHRRTGLRESESTAKSKHESNGSPAPSQSALLMESEILDKVRRKLALEPEPEILESAEPPHNLKEAAQTTESATSTVESQVGSSDQLASQWEDLWSGKAPIELHAEFVLTGKLSPGSRLLLGNEIMEPAPGGFVVWKRKLNTFGQVWPLLEAALSHPSVSAGPSLQFFKGVAPSARMLELHAALEIEGMVSDPSYYEKLPSGLSPDADGKFRLSRMLPDGAVILPGLSLIAG